MSEKTNAPGPPAYATGRGGRGLGGGGREGAQGGGGDAGDPARGDLQRLAKILARISTTLGNLINLDLGVLDEELRAEFIRTWPQAANNLANAIRRLHEGADAPGQNRLRNQLQRVGMTGNMLRAKEVSLNFYLNPLDKIITQPLTDRAGLVEGTIEKLIAWTKPAFKVMNSILGSLLKAFPGMEVVKELKEHVEAGYEIAGVKKELREQGDS